MKLRMYNTEDEVYIKADKIDAVIPVKNENGQFLYSSVLVDGKEIQVCETNDFIIKFLMRQEMS